MTSQGGACLPFAVRIHGRGGQGIVTAAEVLSIAAFESGLHAQAFPSFGSERMGAPVVSFCRLSANPIRVREPVAHPDAVLVCDATLLALPSIFGGLAVGGYVLVNTTRSWRELGLVDLSRSTTTERLCALPAADIARRACGRPLANTVLLGAFAELTGIVGVASMEVAARQRFAGSVADANVLALRAGARHVAGLRVALDA